MQLLSSPQHTPYDGSSQPFGIGLRSLDLSHWIEVDEHLPRYLSEKHRLMSEMPDAVFVEEAETMQAQLEVQQLLISHLLKSFPQIYQARDGVVQIVNEQAGSRSSAHMPPLLQAAMLVQEDLVVMRKSSEGWRLVAASVCFPSSWNLREKFGRPMHEIHAPVPGFSEGTRNALMIERIFDNLKAGMPAERFNWSIYNDDVLFHDDRSGEHFPDNEDENDQYFLRVEHQTLRKLPVSGDILFTIRIHIDPILALAKRNDKREIATEFIVTLEAMTESQLLYKGLQERRNTLIDRLRKIAGTP